WRVDGTPSTPNSPAAGTPPRIFLVPPVSPPSRLPLRPMLRTDALSVASLLTPERVRVGLSVESKEEAIEAVVQLLDGAPAVRDLGRVREDVFAREAVMSTGVGKGLALPHARTHAVT